MKQLLDFIAQHESRGDYNIVWGGIKKQHRPKKPLVTMTIAEVLAWQDGIDPLYQSEAAGRYQIMEDTLRKLYVQAGMSDQDLFDEAGQDRLAVQLLKQRGLDKYLAGQITAETFANNLAKEWASLPCVSGPKKGRSYYDGDGLNKAGVDVAPFLSAVKAIKTAEIVTRPAAHVNETPKSEHIAPKKDRANVTQSTTVRASAVQLASGVGSGVVAVGALDGTAQIVALVLAAVIVLAALWIARERIKHWAEGVR